MRGIMDNRKAMITQTLNFLENEQFNLSLMDSTSTCFDLMARRNSFILMLKFLLNLDSLSEETATDMKALSSLLSAYPLLIGKRTRNFDLQDGVLYGRYGINAFTMNTFANILSEGLYPSVNSSRGGYYVKIDGEKLKVIREDRNISVGELAEKIGVSRTMVYSYENRGLGATLSTVIKLEEYLCESLALPLEVFRIPRLADLEGRVEEAWNEVFLRLQRIGFKIHPIKRAPFDAVTKSENESMLTKVDRRPEKTLKEIELIKEVSGVVDCSAFVVTDSSRVKDNLSGIPVIKKHELERIESPDEFLETLDERR
jgi:putative transcriptional regulator